ncbi:10804_t:CDS:2, partial [Acaulospora morrowiae]
MSADLIWAIVRDNNSFLVKRNGAQFTFEPNNLTNLNSFKYSGLANKKTIGISSAPDNRGVVVTSKKNNVASFRPTKTVHKVALSKGVRKSAKSFTNLYTRAGYRPDLRK